MKVLSPHNLIFLRFVCSLIMQNYMSQVVF